MIKRIGWLAAIWMLGAGLSWAGDGYEVTAKQGDKEITYQVNFGGGRMFDQYTAFDPESKQFVYLQWNRQEQPPKPAMTIWDHQSGELVPLYKFPDAKHPLPIIPSMEAMKVCPITGDRQFKARLVMAID
jgi:hypothetical protein